MKNKLLRLVSILIILCVVGVEYNLRFSNIDMTDARWFVSFWQYHVLAIIMSIVSGRLLSISE